VLKAVAAFARKNITKDVAYGCADTKYHTIPSKITMTNRNGLIAVCSAGVVEKTGSCKSPTEKVQVLKILILYFKVRSC